LSEPDPAPPQSNRLRDVSTIVAAVGLLVTLVFNTIGVWQQVDQAERQADQARETRLYTQVGLLAQLNTLAAEADQGVNETAADERRCDRDTLFTLSDDDENSLYAALDFYEEVAFLFNQKFVTLDAARRHWAPSLADIYDLGGTFFPRTTVARDFAELRRFTHANQARARSRLEPCR
jgi:hypothetical protein